MNSHTIYFLQRRDGLIKIGTTTRFEQRLATLTKSHGPLRVIRTINGDRRREGAIHRQFAAHNEFGEWFRPSVEAEIAALPDGSQQEVTKSDVRREWIAGEQSEVDTATKLIQQMVSLRKMRLDVTKADAIEQLARDYTFPPGFLLHVMRGRARTISAFGMRRLRESAIAEMRLAKEGLEQEVADESLAEKVAAQKAALRQGAARR